MLMPPTIACDVCNCLTLLRGSYITKVATDAALFDKHVAWKSGRREDLGEKFWMYWSRQPASGDWRLFG